MSSPATDTAEDILFNSLTGRSRKVLFSLPFQLDMQSSDRSRSDMTVTFVAGRLDECGSLGKTITTCFSEYPA
jgi:hypothetical protein